MGYRELSLSLLIQKEQRINDHTNEKGVGFSTTDLTQNKTMQKYKQSVGNG
jgi:hypothetical protein